MVQHPRNEIESAQAFFELAGIDAARKAHAAAPMYAPFCAALGHADPVVGEDQDVPDPLQVDPALHLVPREGDIEEGQEKEHHEEPVAEAVGLRRVAGHLEAMSSAISRA